MSLSGIAVRSGISSATLISLINGIVTPGVANRLGISSASLQSFIDGSATPGIGVLLGVRSSTAQELRDLIGREGAIGVLIGLLIEKNRDS